VFERDGTISEQVDGAEATRLVEHGVKGSSVGSIPKGSDLLT